MLIFNIEKFYIFLVAIIILFKGYTTVFYNVMRTFSVLYPLNNIIIATRKLYIFEKYKKYAF